MAALGGVEVRVSASGCESWFARLSRRWPRKESHELHFPTSAHSGVVRTAETAAVTSLPDDMAVKSAVERALDPAERRRFRPCTSRPGATSRVRSAVRCGLRRLMAEATVRMEVAMKETGR